MKQKIYIETSIVSYLTARQSTDAIKLACQQITKAWWNHSRLNTISYISPYVVEEVSAGDPQAASERIKALLDIFVLPIMPEIPQLANFLLQNGGLPTKAKIDALHIACATYHRMDILLTWNCTHIANPVQLPIMRSLCATKGYTLPELITPFTFMESLS